METKSPTFQPRARLILQLGDQLIKDESIAFLELVKNSYDACAKNVSINIQNADIPEKAVIVIEDDGHGMDIDIIKNVWMEPGSDYKEKLLKNGNPDCTRPPLGEKGIGRFAVHKLGNVIELITRKKGHKEIYFSIDWEDFKKSKYLEDVPVHFHEREPIIFKNKSGTRITIKKLNKPWKRGTIREIFRSINSFQYPIFSEDTDIRQNLDRIKIDFNIDKQEWISDILSWEDIKEFALFKFKCEIVGKDPISGEKLDEITTFSYEFIPWKEMTNIKGRQESEQSIEFSLHKKLKKKIIDPKLKETNNLSDSHSNEIALSDYNVGKIRFEGLIFDRDVSVMRLGVHQDKKGFKDFLNRNGGIKVYRDGIRIYDYGESGNDWLNLGIRRVNRLGDRISNNIIIGAIYLDRRSSSDLIEKTNREGFIENNATERFRSAILDAISVVEIYRNCDKEKIRLTFGPKSKSEPIRFSFLKLRDLIEQIKEIPVRKQLLHQVGKIEDDYTRINEILLKSAGSARNLSMVIHEIDKNVDIITQAIKNNSDSETLLNLTKKLSDLVEGYTILIKKTKMERVKLDDIIDQAIQNIDYRLKAHKIELIKNINPNLSSFQIKCNRSLLISSIMNLIDNSIYWVEKQVPSKKKIFISISDEKPGFITILIADNGPGFTIPTELCTEPFVTGKPDGMGLGLFIVDNVMRDHEGMIIFPDWADFTIPEDFKSGGIVGLSFQETSGSK